MQRHSTEGSIQHAVKVENPCQYNNTCSHAVAYHGHAMTSRLDGTLSGASLALRSPLGAPLLRRSRHSAFSSRASCARWLALRRVETLELRVKSKVGIGIKLKCACETMRRFPLKLRTMGLIRVVFPTKWKSESTLSNTFASFKGGIVQLELQQDSK